MKKLVTLFLSIIFVQSSFAAAPPVTDYAYEMKVSTVFQERTEAKIVLTDEVLKNNDEDFGQLQLVDANNEPVPFTLYDEAAKQVNEIDTFQVSSARNDLSPGNLLDDNRLTEFAFDEKTDGSDASTIMIDFGRVAKLHRIELWAAQNANIRGYELRSGLRADQMRTLKRQTAFQTYTDLDFPPLQFLEIRLWGNNIKLEDLNLYERAQAEVYFTAEPDNRYRVLFGNPNLDSKRYLARISEMNQTAKPARTTPAALNPLFPIDFDGDSIANQDDNCPFEANKNQKDTDEDLIGDSCDNAPEAKNFTQLDVDRDGVGDIVDNCKLVSNSNQANKDKDDFGDACDTNPETALSSLKPESSSSLFWLGLVAVTLLGLTAFIIGSKQK